MWFERFRNRRAQGDAYELRAREFLEANGLTFVRANWQTPQGEIDLAMREGARLVFVEVRQRTSASHGGALASINTQKETRLLRAVEAYLSRLPTRPDYRIDAVIFDADDTPQWVKNVFS
ncbi:MAG: YraN family protein [Burkholderiales bacterium]|nr:MAG: YraN family protein [Burkholderiales bacterium]TAG84079.1 MAG: YraN family protein [Betaproteobacteria bacterium]